MRQSHAVLAGLLALAAPLAGQQVAASTDSTMFRLPRWELGLAADIGQPVSALKRNVNNGVGVQAHALLRLDREGRVAMRVQSGWLNYGAENQRTCLGTPPQCRVSVELSTMNGIFTLALGPQVAVPVGRARAYGFGLVGVSRFATLSGVGGGLLPDIIAADENFGDGGALWTGGVGVQVPVFRHTSIDIGMAFENHGTRNYLLKGGVTDRPDGSLAFDVKRSRADLLAFRIGFSTAIGAKTRRAEPAP